MRRFLSNKMPRDGAIIFGDLIGVRVLCPACVRSGHYRLQALMKSRGYDAKIIDWLDEITAAVPRSKRAIKMSDQCGARCPDLSKVL
jgi:hypothetical protein